VELVLRGEVVGELQFVAFVHSVDTFSRLMGGVGVSLLAGVGPALAEPSVGGNLSHGSGT
jgi:hypothetical protein